MMWKFRLINFRAAADSDWTLSQTKDIGCEDLYNIQAMS